MSSFNVFVVSYFEVEATQFFERLEKKRRRPMWNVCIFLVSIDLDTKCCMLQVLSCENNCLMKTLIGSDKRYNR